MLLVVFLNLWLGWELDVLWDHFLQFVFAEVVLDESFGPDENIVVFSVCDKDLIESSEVLVVVGVHDSEHIEAVVLDLLQWVAIECQTLEVVESLELSGLLQVGDVVAMKVESLELWEVEELVFDLGQVVV